MHDRTESFILADVLRMAESEYPALMKHPDNRDDAFQELALVQYSGIDEDVVEAARSALRWLEYELGVCSHKPEGFPPYFPPPGEFCRGSILDAAA